MYYNGLPSTKLIFDWMKRRTFLENTTKGIFISSAVFSSEYFSGYKKNRAKLEKRAPLYNGIILPEEWPPRHFRPELEEPMPVPYLQNPPSEIPIDVGRQLFVDDFLVENTTLARRYHQAKKYEGNPVFRPQSADELGGKDGKRSVVYTGHGGLFFDWEEGLFKMFYRAGWLGGLALATSKDLIHWQRPELGLAGGNLLLPRGPVYTGEQLATAGSDNSVWLDMEAANPRERIKYLTCWMHVPADQRPAHTTHTMHVSDGKKWSKAYPTGKFGDYCSFFYNPFRKVWVSSIRVSNGPRGRCRYYSENADFLEGADWSKAVYWTNTDRFDQPEPAGGYPGAGDAPQLYSLNAVAYESILVGIHQILRGPQNAVCDAGKFPKLTDLELGYSRDGFHWHRPDRRGFIAAERTEGTWDRGYNHTITGIFAVLGDKLVFPYTGFSGIAADGTKGSYNGASIGLAYLRRDGFASLDAGTTTGTLTTRPITFSGRYLFINASVTRGTLKTEVQDLSGTPIAPFTLANSLPFKGDSTLAQMLWKGGSDLSKLVGRPVRLHFELVDGSFYAFWVSQDDSGRSDGYVAAGGPDFPGIKDTVGDKTLR